MGDAAEGDAPVARRTSRLAVASLVLGILAIVLCPVGVLAGIPAVILGIVALAKIAGRKAGLGGRGLATAGIVMGGFMSLVAAVAIPSLLGMRIVPGEPPPVACLRTYAGAQTIYRRSDYDGNLILEYAHPYVRLNTDEFEGVPIKLIDAAFANASRDDPPGGETVPKGGYVFVDLVGDEGGEYYAPGGENYVHGFGLCAVPAEYGRTGRSTYVINHTGAIYMKDTGGKALTRFPDVSEGWVSVDGY